MTTREVELAERLRRVWVPEMELKLTRDMEGSFGFSTDFWREGVEFRYFYCQRAERFGYVFEINRKNNTGRWMGRIWCHIESGDVDAATPAMYAHKVDLRESYAQFAAQWLPLFRRCCFLSGCPIESTIHERMSWAFEARESGAITREEYEALLSPGGTICSTT